MIDKLEGIVNVCFPLCTFQSLSLTLLPKKGVWVTAGDGLGLVVGI